MDLRKSKLMSVFLVVATIGITVLLGFLKNEYYANEYSTVNAPLPSTQLETLALDLSKQGIFKKIGQPRKLYLRIRKLHNTSDKTMSLRFALTGDDKTAETNIKINSKPFDIDKDICDLAAGEKASLNLYVNLTKEGYQKGSWQGKLLIHDVKKDNELIGQIPIEITREMPLLSYLPVLLARYWVRPPMLPFMIPACVSQFRNSCPEKG